MTEPLQRVLRADKPLTLAGVPTGFLPWLAADFARAAHGTSKGGRAVAIVADEAAMRAVAETVPLFAPEVEVLSFPGWDCLPYDRASPALRVMAERLATLSALQWKREKPQLLLATASAASQRVLTPFRVRQLTRRIAESEQIPRETLVEQLNSLGYQRADTVAEHAQSPPRAGDHAVGRRAAVLPPYPKPADPTYRCCPKSTFLSLPHQKMPSLVHHERGVNERQAGPERRVCATLRNGTVTLGARIPILRLSRR